VQLPGVIYHDSADKSARFIMDCNQRKIPLVFLRHHRLHGRQGERAARHHPRGAKMVNAMSNCIVRRSSITAAVRRKLRMRPRV
jgi:acetyl-CoA carboxylase carboxyltransferase component